MCLKLAPEPRRRGSTVIRMVDRPAGPVLPLAVMTSRFRWGVALGLAAGFLAAAAAPAPGQRLAFEAAYGFWLTDDDTTSRVFHAGVTRPLLGPLGWGFAFVHVQDTRDSLARTLSGGEVSLAIGRDGPGPYALGAVGLGLVHASTSMDAFWSLGAGYAARLLPSLTLGIEGRYRVEDTRMHGFWQIDPADRRGLQLQARVSFGIGAGRGSGERGAAPSYAGSNPVTVTRTSDGASPPESTAPGSPPPANDPYTAALNAGATAEAARLTASVVETALAAMGSPYQWGGSSANGFDCSGLIQYAYGQYGVVLPRMSRDQARMGQAVDRDVNALRPGDVLAFSEAGTASRVTHVGLYVGDGRFIHSSSTGVKLSSLVGTNGEGDWWRRRWVGTRRIVE